MMMAFIPSKFKNVKSFAEMQGFKYAGTIKDDSIMTIERRT